MMVERFILVAILQTFSVPPFCLVVRFISYRWTWVPFLWLLQLSCFIVWAATSANRIQNRPVNV